MGLVAMPGDSANTKNVTIAVAVIGAIATLGAAYFSSAGKSADKPKEQSPVPSIQQTASGAGSINVGHDAVINNVKSADEEAAERVQACEQRHEMKVASERTERNEIIPATAYNPERYEQHIDFRSCAWPRNRYADGDGFLQIAVVTEDGPGQYEATGTTYADRIKAPCEQLEVGYGYGNQGTFEQEPRFTVKADTVVAGETRSLWKNDGTLPFYPDAGEFVVLHNSHDSLQSARCTP